MSTSIDDEAQIRQCEAHGTSTRIACVDCEAPVCPKCLVRTEVGLKCERCAHPERVRKPEMTPRRGTRSLAIAAVGIGMAVVATVVVLVILLTGGESDGPGAGTSDPIGEWRQEAEPPGVRGTAVVETLEDGRVLVAGGGVGAIPLDAAAIFDPATTQWTPVGSLDSARRGHAGASLADGRVLVAGGRSESGLLDSAEIFDPASGEWSATGSMGAPRLAHTLTLLADGRVLTTGGTTEDETAGAGGGQTIAPTNRAEIYDPMTGEWSPTGDMSIARFEHTASSLSDGRVLLVGGLGPDPDAGFFAPLVDVELYDPAVGRFSTGASLTDGRSNHAAAVASTGEVWIAGGVGGIDATRSLRSVEIFDPRRNAWRPGAFLNESRSGATLSSLFGGGLLVAGGESVEGGQRSSLASAEVYSSADERWLSAGEMACPRSEHDAVVMSDESVLVVAGDAAFPGEPPLAQACTDRYIPVRE